MPLIIPLLFKEYKVFSSKESVMLSTLFSEFEIVLTYSLLMEFHRIIFPRTSEEIIRDLEFLLIIK